MPTAFWVAHVHTVDGIPGILFAVWAPNAERVSVVGDFNQWDGRRHPMRVRGGSGVWELFLPDLEPGTLYKYEIRNRETGGISLKADPYAQAFEMRPRTASIITAPSDLCVERPGLDGTAGVGGLAAYPYVRLRSTSGFLAAGTGG